MRRFSSIFFISLFLFGLPGQAETYRIIHRSLMQNSVQNRTITVKKLDNQTLQLKASPIFFSNDAFYEAAYQIRRNSSGNRLGSRDYWRLPTRSEIQANSYHEKDCKVDKANAVFDVRLKLHFDLSQKNLKNWSKLFCFSQDREAFSVILPELILLLKPQIAELNNFQTLLRQKFLEFMIDKNWDALSQSLTIVETLNTELQLDPQDIRHIEATKERNFVLSDQVSRNSKNLTYDPTQNISKPFVVVSHASSQFDLTQSIRPFSSEVLAQVKHKELPIYFLMHNDSQFDLSWFLNQTTPTQVYFSKNGEHNLRFSSNQVILMGGFYNECLRTTQMDLITRYFLNQKGPLIINMPISAIYAHKSIRFDELTKEAFIKNVIEGSILGGYEIEDDHGDITTNDMNRLTGIPLIHEYQLQIFTDHKLVRTFGEGSKVVQLQFWSDHEFLIFLKGLNL